MILKDSKQSTTYFSCRKNHTAQEIFLGAEFKAEMQHAMIKLGTYFTVPVFGIGSATIPVFPVLKITIITSYL